MKKSVLTSQGESFADWYNDVVREAELADYGPVKGTMIIRPYGYAIWENIQRIFDNMIKAKGIQNAYFPLFIPESFLKKEKDHVKGFSPELAVVTHAGGEKLDEPVVVRPTSETIIYNTFSNWIGSYRDLPLEVNQWCNIVRWEKRTKPFIRTTEFLWQEGHSALATRKESDEKALERLSEYQKFFEEILAIPVFTGKKTESEKFAGAVYSGSCEALLKDGKALQSATSHDMGENFSKPFNIMYEDKDGKRKYPSLSSWGLSTRTIGALILLHGDDKGLVLPPLVAPIQVVIIPIYKDEKEKMAVEEIVGAICDKYSKQLRLYVDDRDAVGFGWKSTEWEIKGVPVRIEVGPKDAATDSVTVVSRTAEGKTSVEVKDLNLDDFLYDIQEEIFEKAVKVREEGTHRATDFAQFATDLEKKKGFFLADWCGDAKCEAEIKQKTKATTRVIPFEQNLSPKAKCFHCGNEAEYQVYFAKAY